MPFFTGHRQPRSWQLLVYHRPVTNQKLSNDSDIKSRDDKTDNKKVKLLNPKVWRTKNQFS